MSDPSGAVQAGLIARYRGDSTLQGILSGYNSAIAAPEWNIFDQGGAANIVPPPKPPYVYVNQILNTPGSFMSMGKDAKDIRMLINVFTQTDGFYQALAIMARIYDLSVSAAGASALTLSGFNHIWTWFENRTEQEKTTDVLTQQLSDRYNFQITVT